VGQHTRTQTQPYYHRFAGKFAWPDQVLGISYPFCALAVAASCPNCPPRTGATFNLISSLKFHPLLPALLFFPFCNFPTNVQSSKSCLGFTLHMSQTNTHTQQHVEHAQEVCKTRPRPLRPQPPYRPFRFIYQRRRQQLFTNNIRPGQLCQPYISAKRLWKRI